MPLWESCLRSRGPSRSGVIVGNFSQRYLGSHGSSQGEAPVGARKCFGISSLHYLGRCAHALPMLVQLFWCSGLAEQWDWLDSSPVLMMGARVASNPTSCLLNYPFFPLYCLFFFSLNRLLVLSIMTEDRGGQQCEQ